MSSLVFIVLCSLLLAVNSQSFIGSNLANTYQNQSLTCDQPLCTLRCHDASTCPHLTIVLAGATSVLNIECMGESSCQNLTIPLPPEMYMLSHVNITCSGEDSCHHLVVDVRIQHELHLLCQDGGCQHSRLTIMGLATTQSVGIAGRQTGSLSHSEIDVSNVETLIVSCSEEFACTRMQLSLGSIVSSTIGVLQGQSSPFFGTTIASECDQMQTSVHILSCPTVLELRCGSEEAYVDASCVQCTMDETVASPVIAFDNNVGQWAVSAVCAAISTTAATSITTTTGTTTSTTSSQSDGSGGGGSNSDTGGDMIKGALLVLCAVFLMILVALIFWWIRRQKQRRKSKGDPIPYSPESPVRHDHHHHHHYNQPPSMLPPLPPHLQIQNSNQHHQGIQMQVDPRVHPHANANPHVMPPHNAHHMHVMQSPNRNPKQASQVKVFVQNGPPAPPGQQQQHVQQYAHAGHAYGNVKPDPRELELYDTSGWHVHKRTSGETPDGHDTPTYPQVPHSLQPGENPDKDRDIFRQKSNNSFDSSEMYKTFQNRQNGLLSDDPEAILKQWMAGIVGLPQYTHLLIANDIRLEEMPTITRDDLTQIGITSVGHQLKILQNAQDLKQLL